jgi:hypothetical protein
MRSRQLVVIRHVVSTQLACLAWLPVAASAQSIKTGWPASCPFAGDSLRTPSGSRISTGEYAFAVLGSDSAGAIVTGKLVLAEAKPSDRSTRTHQLALDRRRRVVLVGWTDAKLERAGVDVDSAFAPPLTSHDPVFPGVLVEYQGTSEQFVMEIGTGSNSRNDEDPNHPGMMRVSMDGPGSGFWVRKIEPGLFAGTFHPWGLSGGDGYFCARLVAPPPA